MSTRSLPDAWTDPRQMQPLLPEQTEDWSIRATEFIREATFLEGEVRLNTRRALAPLLRVMNSYYSNLIEGSKTLPGEIDRAVRRAQASGGKKDHQLVSETAAHFFAQSLIEEKMQLPGFEPTDVRSLRQIHTWFFGQLSPDLLWTEALADGTRFPIVPGELRTHPVYVGVHVPPNVADLQKFLDEFHAIYRDHRRASPEALARIAAAHQRCMWIHPFIDGNGRVGRLMTDAMLAGANLGGGGLWCVSRGFARSNNVYKARLADADAPRQGDLDGRHNLTQTGMNEWCRFFLETAVDQVRFMRKMLGVHQLPDRIAQWAPNHLMPKRARKFAFVLEHAIRYGEAPRSLITEIFDVSERQALRLMEYLINRGLSAPSPTGGLLPQFPLRVAPYWFPDLFPLELNRDLAGDEMYDFADEGET